MFQKMQVIGRLGADPDIRYTPDGTAVANLRVATDETYKDKKTGNKITHTEWHRCVMFDRMANSAAEYLTKGRLIFLEGKLRTRKWTDKDGIDRWTTEIICSNMRMLDSTKKRETTPADNAPPLDAVPESLADLADEDIPF